MTDGEMDVNAGLSIMQMRRLRSRGGIECIYYLLQANKVEYDGGARITIIIMLNTIIK